MNMSMKTIKISIVAGMMLSSSAALAMVDHHEVPANIKAAVANSERSERDFKSDAGRKPAEVLTFIGIKDGMSVLDINSGSGYYTELLSHAVGPDGKVIAHNGGIYWNFVKKNIAKRYDDRLANVTQIHNGHEEVDVPAASIDVATLMMAYHDYFLDSEGREKPEDMAAIMVSIYNSLKDGGTLIVTDHIAPTGSGTEAGQTLHRIDPALVKKQILAAGFKLVATSDLLSNSDDDHTINVFNPEIRGKTDRFIMKFQK